MATYVTIESPEVQAGGTLSIGRRLLVQSFLWSFSGDMLSKVAVLATTLIAARSLNPAAFGQFIGLAATSVLAASVWDTGVTMLLTREAAAGHIDVRSGVVQAFRLRLRTLPLWLVVFSAGVLVLNSSHAVSPAVVLAWSGASLVFGAHAVLLAVLRADMRFRLAGIALFSGRWLTAAISMLALTSAGSPNAAVLLALAAAAGELLTLALAAIVWRPKAEGATTALEGRLRLRAALPFAANSVLSTAYNRFDVVLLAALTSGFSKDQLALYAPATRIQDALYFIPSALGAIALPVIARVWGKRHLAGDVAPQVGRFVLIGLAIGLPITVALTITASLFLPLILGSGYAGAATATRILVWSLPVSAIGSPVMAALAGSGHAGDTTRAFTAAFVAALALHLMLDPVWGATGAAAASLTRDVVNLAVAGWLARRSGVLDLRLGRWALRRSIEPEVPR
jgi:O-antigen/teichoic acid export membrane protein